MHKIVYLPIMQNDLFEAIDYLEQVLDASGQRMICWINLMPLFSILPVSRIHMSCIERTALCVMKSGRFP